MKKFAVLLLVLLCFSLSSCGSDEDDLAFLLSSTTTTVSEVEEESISSILSEEQFQLGMFRFYNRQYQAAIQLFNKALAFDPMNFDARYYLGYSYLNSGYVDNAITEWEYLIALGGGDYQVKQKLNALYFRLAIDKEYDFTQPYVFYDTFNGLTDGRHKVIRPSFIEFDPYSGSLLTSCVDTRYVVEIDGNSEIVQQIGRRFGDFSHFGVPTGIAVTETNIYIADFEKDTIFLYDKFGKEISSFGESGYGLSNIAGPMGLYLSTDDYLYIVDNGNDRIQKFDLDGTWVQSIGTGELSRPTDIVGDGTTLYVSDTGNSRVAVFDRFGNLLSSIGEGLLDEPRGLALTEDALYIVDSTYGVKAYDFETEEIESLGVDSEDLLYPFDLCLDNLNLIYETDYNSQYIAVYEPLQLLYDNLLVDVNQIWTEHYPENSLYIRVRDKSGAPITGLEEANFTVSEIGTEIPFPRLGGTYEFRDNMFIYFVIDKSVAMENYTEELEEFLNAFLDEMSGDDWLALKLVDEEVSSSERRDASVLWPLDFALSNQYTEAAPSSMGTALYDSVTELLNIYRNKAIVLFTAGEIGDDSFPVYGTDVVATYAYQNAVPIYVVNLSGENADTFRRLAEDTYGTYYELSETREILALHNEIENQEPLEYILTYEGMNLTGIENYWVDVHVEVEYKGVIGVDDTGYYVPESVLSEGITLEDGEELPELE